LNVKGCVPLAAFGPFPFMKILVELRGEGHEAIERALVDFQMLALKNGVEAFEIRRK
jgi:hypothetical protein